MRRRDELDTARKYYNYAFRFGKQAADIAQLNYSKEPNESTKKAFVNASGTVSFAALLAHQPLVAAQFADTAFNVDSSQIAIDVNRAHTLRGRTQLWSPIDTHLFLNGEAPEETHLQL